MKRLWNLGALVAVFAVVLATCHEPPPPTTTTTTSPPTTAPPTTTTTPPCAFPTAHKAMADKLRDLHNQARAQNGRPAMTYTCDLAVYARERAESLRVRHGDACIADHVGFDPSRAEGENAGCLFVYHCDATTLNNTTKWGQVTTPQAMFNEWMDASDDPDHRAAILGTFTHFGAGWACQNGRTYAVVDFDRR